MAINVEALEQLVRVLKDVPGKQFDISVWNDRRSCRTVGCAMGWAARDRWFKQRGFRLSHPRSFHSGVEYKGLLAFEAVRQFFGFDGGPGTITPFHPDYYSGEHKISKTDVIRAIRELIRESKAEPA